MQRGQEAAKGASHKLGWGSWRTPSPGPVRLRAAPRLEQGGWVYWASRVRLRHPA